MPGTRLLKPSPPCLPRDSLGRSPCIDCDGPCVDACPEQVIEATVGERAKLSFAGGGCTFCGDCLEVCPQARDAAEKEIGAANIIRSECLAWQGVVCMSCRLACGDGAIEMDAKNRPKMRDRACTGCGLCVAPCPSDAIDVRVSVALS